MAEDCSVRGSTRRANQVHCFQKIRAKRSLLALGGALGEVLVELGLFCLTCELHLLLLCDGVEVGGEDEADEGEEGLPHHGGEVVLGDGDGDGRGGPGDAHDRPEGGLDGPLDVVDAACAVDVGHAREVDGVGKHRYGEVGGDDLEDLVARGGAADKGLLQQTGEHVAHGCRDEEAVDKHLERALIDAELGGIRLKQTDGVLLRLTLLLIQRRGGLGGGGRDTSEVTRKHLSQGREHTRCDHPEQNGAERAPTGQCLPWQIHKGTGDL
ncbi:hypothetical protein L1887_58171 [Cichorium endivia]|nr:hypothetical protein L1887_58171 [Cichorium endivia]